MAVKDVEYLLKMDYNRICGGAWEMTCGKSALAGKWRNLEMRKTIHAEKAPAAVGPYVHAVQAGNMVFTSGQLGLDPQDGSMPEGIQAQTHQALKNLGAVLEAAGLGYEDVVRTMVFLDSMDDFAAVNEIYAQYFKESAPARSCVEVARLPKGGLIEIEAIAVQKD